MKKASAPEILVMVEDYWRNSHLSVVSHFGQIRFNGYRYIIVNKEGKDVWECSREAMKLGRDKAIPPGEPCDLIYDKLQPAYRVLGRDKIVSLLKEKKSFDEIKEEASKLTKNQQVKKQADESHQLRLDFG